MIKDYGGGGVRGVTDLYKGMTHITVVRGWDVSVVVVVARVCLGSVKVQSLQLDRLPLLHRDHPRTGSSAHSVRMRNAVTQQPTCC